MINGRAIIEIRGAEFPEIDNVPQKLVIKLITKDSESKITNRFVILISLFVATITGQNNIIGKAFKSQFVKDLANIYISRLGKILTICSMVPSSKSSCKNLTLIKVSDETRANNIIAIM